MPPRPASVVGKPPAHFPRRCIRFFQTYLQTQLSPTHSQRLVLLPELHLNGCQACLICEPHSMLCGPSCFAPCVSLYLRICICDAGPPVRILCSLRMCVHPWQHSLEHSRCTSLALGMKSYWQQHYQTVLLATLVADAVVLKRWCACRMLGTDLLFVFRCMRLCPMTLRSFLLSLLV